jgi:uncharacterized protein YbjQ (UPF0145 family)
VSDRSPRDLGLGPVRDLHLGGDASPEIVDIKSEMLNAAKSLSRPSPTLSTHSTSSNSTTSDLTIDEEFALHSIGWEPIELVCGVSLHSVPMGIWTWGQGEITYASTAYARSFANATERLGAECARAGGHGVVGVHVERSVHRHHIDVALVGTAVRPVGSKQASARPVFVSDLSGRDFTLLHASGWVPLGLAVGASFVYAPRRSMSVAMKQKSQNVELTNFTEAMYSARESAMERMQQSAIAMQGTGVVEVKVTEGPMDFAGHAIGFTAYGTVVRLEAEQHRNLGPRMVLSLDDTAPAFDTSALRGD